MYKTCFLINAGEDPFRFKGRDAEDAIRVVFPEIKVMSRPERCLVRSRLPSPAQQSCGLMTRL